MFKIKKEKKTCKWSGEGIGRYKIAMICLRKLAQGHCPNDWGKRLFGSSRKSVFVHDDKWKRSIENVMGLTRINHARNLASKESQSDIINNTKLNFCLKTLLK